MSLFSRLLRSHSSSDKKYHKRSHKDSRYYRKGY